MSPRYRSSPSVRSPIEYLLAGESAPDGAEAIERFRELRPDVTLMDLRLPDISGIDALIAIRTESPDACVVMLTTFEGDVEIQRGLALRRS